MTNGGNKLSSIYCHGSSIGNHRGSALIITLLMITVLASLVIQFTYDVYIDTSTLSNWSSAQKASNTAKSGIVLSSAFITEVEKLKYTDKAKIELPVDKNLTPDTNLKVEIEDESAKFNINSIISSDGITIDSALLSLQKLLESLNINPDSALLIADWMDNDNNPRVFGSEKGAKNREFWSIEELRSVDGIKKDHIDVLMPYITIYGDSLINVNTAKIPVLVSLHKDMTDSLAKRIIDYRETSPFEDTAHVQRVSGMETIGPQFIGKSTVKSSNFRVTSSATVKDVTRVIESVLDRSMRIHFWREN